MAFASCFLQKPWFVCLSVYSSTSRSDWTDATVFYCQPLRMREKRIKKQSIVTFFVDLFPLCFGFLSSPLFHLYTIFFSGFFFPLPLCWFPFLLILSPFLLLFFALLLFLFFSLWGLFLSSFVPNFIQEQSGLNSLDMIRSGENYPLRAAIILRPRLTRLPLFTL